MTDEPGVAETETETETETEDADLADVLRRVRVRHREQREELEAFEEQTERAQRRFEDVALEFLYRGDSIRLSMGPRSWTGVVVHVGAQLLALRTPTGTEIDVNFDALTSVRVVARARSGGRSAVSRDPASIAARLRQLEASGEPVELGGLRLDPPLAGTVVAVAKTHIEVRGLDGTEWVVLAGEVGYIVRQAKDEAVTRRR